MTARETGLRRVGLITAGLAVIAAGGTALIAHAVSDSSTGTTSTTQSTTDSGANNNSVVQPGSGPAHANSGGS
jgi:hypothetical protein